MANQVTNTALLAVIQVILLPHQPWISQETPRDKAAKDKRTTVSLRVQVTSGRPSAPVENATVYVKSEETPELNKTCLTNHRGVAQWPEAPRGWVVIHVTARGRKDFGKRYELGQKEELIHIELESEAATEN